MRSQYLFLPWLRRGLAKDITEIDPLGGLPATQARAQMQFELDILGDDLPRKKIAQTVELFSPGDVTGIDRRAIVKVEPDRGELSFEPNFFPYIEFYEEDFLWRYTPAAPNGERLRPWLALLTLEESEFELLNAHTGAGNPVIAVRGGTDSPLFPPSDQSWLWAHVQINDGTLPASDPADPAERDRIIADSLSQSPNLGVSRLISPRKLRPNTRYAAFLVPAFEKGRLAGIGADKAAIDEAGLFQAAWGSGQTIQPGHLPVYYQWQFRTGTDDFESLAAKIEGRDLGDTEIGKIWVDLRDPGYGTLLSYHGNLDPSKPAHQGFLPYEGALRLPVPSGTPTPNLVRNTGTEEKRLVKNFAGLLNLGLDYRKTEQLDWQNISELVFSDDTDDPLVIPPVYGARYTGDADLRLDPANINSWPEELNLDPAFRAAAGLGAEVVRAHQEELVQRAWEQLALRQTLNRRLQGLRLAQEVTKATFQKHFGAADAAGSETAVNRQLALTQSLHAAVQSETGVSVAGHIRDYPADAAFVRPVYRKLTRTQGPIFRRLTASIPNQINTFSVIMSGTVQFSTIAFFILTDPSFQNFSSREMAKVDATKFIFQPGPWPNVVMPWELPNWHGNLPGKIFMVGRQAIATTFAKIKNQLLPKPNLVKPPAPDLLRLSLKIRERIDPGRSFVAHFASLLPQTTATVTPTPENLAPHTFNPVFLEPVYEYLSRLRPDLFIPNLDQLPPNSFALLQANQPFIESFMVGLNHEMAGELLWRGFPADLNATFFRQFWDAADNADLPEGADRSDIKAIRNWGRKSSLGHNLPEGAVANPLVFVIKGDLIKRYPNLVVYAQKAVRNKNGRKPIEATKSPLFLASMAPDLLFAGFALTREEVLDLSQPDDQKAGWYFVLAERPGEMHFGLDLPGNDGKTTLWNHLNWGNLPPDTEVLDVDVAVPPNPFRENLAWGKGLGARPDDPASGNGDAAQMAAILQQRPVRVFVHASVLVR